MASYSSRIGSSLVRLACVLVALGTCAAAPAAQLPPLNIAVSNVVNDAETGSSLIYSVTATPLANSPPSLALSVLPPNTTTIPPGYAGFNTLAYVPNGATVDLIAAEPNNTGGVNASFTLLPAGTSFPGFAPYTSGNPYSNYGIPRGGILAPTGTTIWRFFGPTYSGTVATPPAAPGAVPIYSCVSAITTCQQGPQNPISMAVDGNGNLYVLSLDILYCNYAETAYNVVDLFGFVPVAISATNPSGFLGPFIIDQNVAGIGPLHGLGGKGPCAARDYSKSNIDAGLGAELPDPSYVMDLMIAPSGVAAPLMPNDVLVLFGDPAPNVGTPVALIADYNAVTVSSVLSNANSESSIPYYYYGSGATFGDPAAALTPLTVLNSSDVLGWGQAFIPCIPATIPPTFCLHSEAEENALSIAAWPVNSSILVMTQLGNIYDVSWSTNTGPTYEVFNDPVFWSGANGNALPSAYLGNTTGNYQAATLRTAANTDAFVTAYTVSYTGAYEPSEVLSLDSSQGANSPMTVSESDGPLAGLAVSGDVPPPPPPTQGTAQGCVTGCNITGGVAQQIMGTPAAIKAVEALLPPNNTITENVCIVEADPREICGGTDTTNWLYDHKTLPVKSVCPDSPLHPSFGNTVIPDYICGNYKMYGGEGKGTGLVVIQGIAPGVDAIPGLLDYSDANPDYFFSSTPLPCTMQPLPDLLFGWAPWTGDTKDEGTIPEGLKMTELTYGCGTSKGISSGMSLLLVGGKLNLNGVTEFKPGNLVSFAEFKYDNLLADVAQAPIDRLQKLRLLEIITESEEFLKHGQTACATRKVWRADKYVSDHAGHFHGRLGQDPNPYGRARSRLANLFFTIHSRIEGKAPPSVWPLSRPPEMCTHDQDIDRDGY